MSAVFFGAPWDAPTVDWAEQGPTPVGQQCLHCGEDVIEGDRGWHTAALTIEEGVPVGRPAVVHAECQLLGIVGHTVGVCGCTGYGHDRAAARECWARQTALRGGRPLEELSPDSLWYRDDEGAWRKRAPEGECV